MAIDGLLRIQVRGAGADTVLGRVVQLLADVERASVPVLRLFERIPDDNSARDELVAKFQPLAEYFARRFAGRGEPIEDLNQVANIGLLSAMDRFDPTREVQFATYAAAA